MTNAGGKGRYDQSTAKSPGQGGIFPPLYLLPALVTCYMASTRWL